MSFIDRKIDYWEAQAENDRNVYDHYMDSTYKHEHSGLSSIVPLVFEAYLFSEYISSNKRWNFWKSVRRDVDIAKNKFKIYFS